MMRNEFFKDNDFYAQKIDEDSIIPNLRVDLFDRLIGLL